MSGLVSKWADDPDLVDKAKKQDNSPKKESKSKWSSTISSEKGKPLESKWASPVTSEKGKPLVSRWADAADEEEDQDKGASKSEPKKFIRKQSPKKQSPRKHKHHNEHNHNQKHEDLSDKLGKSLQIEDDEDDEKVEMSPEAKKLASRLGISDDNGASKPKIHFKREHEKKQTEDDWEDEEEDTSEEEEEVSDFEGEEKEEIKPVPPTKAAEDFASRLGISIGDKTQIRNNREKERNKLRDDRIKSHREWDNGKNQHKSHDNHREWDHGKSHRSHDNSYHQKPQRREPLTRREVTPRRSQVQQRESKPEPAENPVIDEETRRKQIEADKRLEEFINKGGEGIDWADFEDDY